MTVSYFADHPEIEKIFKDLESFKEFCRFNAMRWNEANLYQKESREWRAYERNKSNAKHKFKRKFQKR